MADGAETTDGCGDGHPRPPAHAAYRPAAPPIPAESDAYLARVFAARRNCARDAEAAVREAMWLRGFMLAPHGEWSRPHLGTRRTDDEAFRRAFWSADRRDSGRAFRHVFRAAWRGRVPGGAGWHWPGGRSVFFARLHGVQRVPVAALDPGVALLVKSLALVGVSTWCSCDGHHLLTGPVREAVGPARIWLCDGDGVAWLTMLVDAVRPVLRLRSEIRFDFGRRREMMSVAGRAADPLERAWEQDRDMNNLGRLFAIVPFSDRVRELKATVGTAEALHAALGPMAGVIRYEAQVWYRRNPTMFIE